MRTILVISATALALTACSKAGDAKGGDGTAAAAAPASGAASGLPKRKAGLWEQVILHDGKALAMGKISQCIDAATDAQMSMFGQSLGKRMDCQRSISRGLDGSYAYSSTCNMGQGGTVTSKGSVSGDFSSGYKIVSQSDTTGAAFAAMNGHHVMEIDATYAGACPAGMTPGDVSVNGTTINMAKMLNAGGGTPKS